MFTEQQKHHFRLIADTVKSEMSRKRDVFL